MNDFTKAMMEAWATMWLMPFAQKPEPKPIKISTDDYPVTRWGSKRRSAQFHRCSS
jgi:flagellar motor protein MotB